MDEEQITPAAQPLARGRGTARHVASRFAPVQIVPVVEDGLDAEGEEAPKQLPTVLTMERARGIITRNKSPDVPFERSINPYYGCEHGCFYCFARPSHSYRDLNPGLDFETRIFAKENAPELLLREFSRANYQPATIVLGSNTDIYQPVERSLGLTRALLQIMADCQHPVALITKSALILRDLDILRLLASMDLVRVAISITTLDPKLARAMEPRASSPRRRLEAVAGLAQAGIPVSVLASPMIPAVNDHELESILAAAARAGATNAGMILVRLPHELRELFEGWLDLHMPARKQRVITRLKAMRGGELYRSNWGERMRGQGPEAELLQQRFKLAREKYHLRERSWDLNTSYFRPPPTAQRKPTGQQTTQLSLF